MSYILEALKRADREREQGHVPGLHSQQASYLEAPADDEPRVSPALGWVLGGATLAGLGAAGWLWLQDEPAPAPSAAPPLAARQPAAVRPGNVPTVPPVPPVAVAAAPAALPAAPPPALRLEPPRPLPKPKVPVAAPAQPEVPPAPAPVPLPGSTAPIARAPAPAAAVGAVPAAAPRVPAASLPNAAKAAAPGPMPEEVRRELPALGISGSVYSDRPADRMLIVNGQVLRERDELAPGFMLERIQPKSAIVLHKGQRYVFNF